MMIVNKGDQDFLVKFHHLKREYKSSVTTIGLYDTKTKSTEKTETIGTECFIFVGDKGALSKEMEFISSGVSEIARDKKTGKLLDIHNKAKGRKISFTKALMIFNEETRILFWNEYFKVHNLNLGTKNP